MPAELRGSEEHERVGRGIEEGERDRQQEDVWPEPCGSPLDKAAQKARNTERREERKEDRRKGQQR